MAKGYLKGHDITLCELVLEQWSYINHTLNLWHNRQRETYSFPRFQSVSGLMYFSVSLLKGEVINLPSYALEHWYCVSISIYFSDIDPHNWYPCLLTRLESQKKILIVHIYSFLDDIQIYLFKKLKSSIIIVLFVSYTHKNIWIIKSKFGWIK